MSAFSKVDSAALFEGLLGGEDWLWGVTVAVGILAAANYYDHLAEMGIEEGMRAQELTEDQVFVVRRNPQVR